MQPIPRMIELTARGNGPVVDVLFSCGEFTRAEIIEYLPEVLAVRRGSVEPIRCGVVS
jgi:hypothetical protein